LVGCGLTAGLHNLQLALYSMEGSTRKVSVDASRARYEERRQEHNPVVKRSSLKISDMSTRPTFKRQGLLLLALSFCGILSAVVLFAVGGYVVQSNWKAVLGVIAISVLILLLSYKALALGMDLIWPPPTTVRVSFSLERWDSRPVVNAFSICSPSGLMRTSAQPAGVS